MIGPKMQEALNRHVQAEKYSAYLYLAMSAWCEAHTWKVSDAELMRHGRVAFHGSPEEHVLF